jgi:hypothetical protein
MCRGDGKLYLRFRYVEISAPALPAYRYQNIAICGTGTAVPVRLSGFLVLTKKIGNHIKQNRHETCCLLSSLGQSLLKEIIAKVRRNRIIHCSLCSGVKQ